MAPNTRQVALKARPNRKGNALLVGYLLAKAAVVDAGFEAEIAWQEHAAPSDVDDETFLREAAWVILSCGMRESVVRRRFQDYSAAFLQWKSARAILRSRRKCRNAALQAFNHPAKADAILAIAEALDEIGSRALLAEVMERGVDTLFRFPYLGPATARHLLKNLGFPVSKPDRHLVRAAEWTGLGSCEELCDLISAAIGDPVQVVDVVIWRSSTLDSAYWRRVGDAVRSEDYRADEEGELLNG
jgi:hypothetical protein